jgi:hypothetical protein
MQNSHNQVGVPVGEPKDGDFVAYLAQIEKRQLAALPARAAHTPPSLNGPHTPSTESQEDWTERAPLGAVDAERLRQQLARDSGQLRRLIGAALMGLFGLFFTVQGLLADGGFVAFLIGAFLLWRAWAAVRKTLGTASTAQRDLAARLVDTLRQAQKK